MVATSWKNDCVYKYTRTNKQSLDWTQDCNTEIPCPTAIRCINKDMYVVSNHDTIHWLSQDFTEKQVLVETKQKVNCRVVTFSDHLCTYFQDSK